MQFNDGKMCSGCGACSVSCPQNCISMQEDEYGFLYPVVDKENCIDCTKCIKVCPYQNKEEKTYDQSAYAAYSLDENTRFQGSSGGLFGELAKKVIAESGVVYGAAFDNNLKLKMSRADNVEKLNCLFKSKYLQSDCTLAYESIKKDLQNGVMVLVCSTPCQIAAIKFYLGMEYDNLICVDFFCHGVPNQSFFDQCMQYEKQKRGSKVTSYQFRTKIRKGVTPHYYTQTHADGRCCTDIYYKSPFYAAFQKYISLRESCYDCRFAVKDRMSDITIGDFHSVNKYIKSINRFDGISMVVVNSEKGNKVLRSISGGLALIEMDIQKLISDGEIFSGGTKKPNGRDEFLKDYRLMGFKEFVNKHLNPKREWKKTIYYKSPHVVRKILKRIVIGE